MKLRASINKNMLNGGEQHLQLPKKGLSAAKITSSLEKRVGSPQQLLAPAHPVQSPITTFQDKLTGATSLVLLHGAAYKTGHFTGSFALEHKDLPRGVELYAQCVV